MKISNRIRSTRLIESAVGKGNIVIPGVSNLAQHAQRIAELGFSFPYEAGEAILPAASYGRSATTNAEGWVEVHRDQKMETAYRQVIWRWTMKRGYSYEEASKLVSVPYKRYPRTEHPPLGLEIHITPKTDGSLIATLPPLTVTAENEFALKLSVNLLVEIFGECDLLTEDLDQIIKAEVKRLNWRVLPPGKRSSEEVEDELEEVVQHLPEKVREVVEYRVRFINQFGPDLFAFGTHGFSGYLVFGFQKKGLFLLESIYFGNATYVLGEQWEDIARLSKGEILNNKLHIARIEHRDLWKQQISKILT